MIAITGNPHLRGLGVEMAEAASGIPVLDIGEMLWQLVDDATSAESDMEGAASSAPTLGVFDVHI